MIAISRARPVCIIALALLASGCEGKLIKDTAATLVKTGSDVTDATAQFTTADNEANIKAITARVADPKSGCPAKRGKSSVSPKTLYVRTGVGDNDSTFNSGLAVLPLALQQSLRASPGCQKLLRCETQGPNPTGECAGVCYSEPESDCIDGIVDGVDAQRKAATSGGAMLDPNSALGLAVSEMRAKLAVISFDTKAIPQSAALATYLNAYSAYLSSLAALGNQSPKDLTPIADHFSNREKEIVDGATKIDPKLLSKDATATQKQIQDASNNADKLIGDVKQMADAQHDANRMKEATAKAEADYQALFPLLQSEAFATAAHVSTAEDQVFGYQAKALLARIDSAKGQDERAQAITAYYTAVQDHRTKLAAAAGLSETYKALLAKMKDAHDHLYRLSTNPNADDERAIAEETITNIVTIVSDILKLYNTFA